MNILVSGSNGQLGNEIRIASKSSRHNYIFTDIVSDVNTVYLDITDIDALRKIVRDNSIELIINCAAYTNVDKAESDFETCELLNATAVKNLSVVMKECDGFLVHISSDYVFGGGNYNTPYIEEMAANPLGVYGLTKLKGEEYIKDSGVKHIIIRTSWLYSEYGKNFVKAMIGLTSSKPSISVVFDQVGTPTYALDLANAIIHIIENGNIEDNIGTYHYSNEGVCSWYDLTKVIGEYCGNSCDIKPCHSNEFPSNVTRPSYSVLDKTKIKKTFGLEIPYWMDSVKRCIENIKAKQAV